MPFLSFRRKRVELFFVEFFDTHTHAGTQKKIKQITSTANTIFTGHLIDN